MTGNGSRWRKGWSPSGTQKNGLICGPTGKHRCLHVNKTQHCEPGIFGPFEEMAIKNHLGSCLCPLTAKKRIALTVTVNDQES